jgi:hypothetical protein
MNLVIRDEFLPAMQELTWIFSPDPGIGFHTKVLGAIFSSWFVWNKGERLGSEAWRIIAASRLSDLTSRLVI